MFEATDATLLFTKHDALDPRIGEFVERLHGLLPAALEKISGAVRPFVFAGYADDEGIRLNGGRIGAAAGPASVRRHLYKMTPSTMCGEPSPVILDLGNLTPGTVDLGERHALARSTARLCLEAGATWLACGGGHDYGYADAAAFSDWCATHGERPLAINFDSHLDLRPYTGSVYSSGTPFSRWLDEFPEVDFLEIGLQGQCNSRAHLDDLLRRGGRALFHESVEASGESLTTQAFAALGRWVERRRPAFISVDIDAFSNAYAPGCSQSFATGLEPAGFFPLLQILLRRFDVRALCVYEVSPPLDEGDRTSKLAAQIFHRALFPI